MSIFLDDNMDTNNNPDTTKTSSTPGQSPLLASEGENALDAFSIPTKKKYSQTGVAMLVLIGAAGVIIGMRQFGMGPAVSFAGLELSYEPAAGAPTIETTKVLNNLDRSRHAVQIPTRYITQDPFVLEATEAAPKTDDSIERQMAEKEKREAAQRKAQQARARELQSAYEKLHLQSCMLGSTPMARINNQIVKVGMSIGEFFTVTQITGRQVTLQADGKDFIITLEDPSIKGNSSRHH